VCPKRCPKTLPGTLNWVPKCIQFVPTCVPKCAPTCAQFLFFTRKCCRTCAPNCAPKYYQFCPKILPIRPQNILNSAPKYSNMCPKIAANLIFNWFYMCSLRHNWGTVLRGKSPEGLQNVEAASHKGVAQRGKKTIAPNKIEKKKLFS